jgi:hypothetical protein
VRVPLRCGDYSVSLGRHCFRSCTGDACGQIGPTVEPAPRVTLADLPVSLGRNQSMLAAKNRGEKNHKPEYAYQCGNNLCARAPAVQLFG